jgi:hypothetical protein
MGSPATHSLRVVGDGQVYDGPCIVKVVVMHPDAADDYADIYDGRDTTSGTKLFRVRSATTSTAVANLGDGIVFGKGVYVDGCDSAVETTVSFIPL